LFKQRELLRQLQACILSNELTSQDVVKKAGPLSWHHTAKHKTDVGAGFFTSFCIKIDLSPFSFHHLTVNIIIGAVPIILIIHELLHLQVPNHGKLFKSLLRAYVPDWEKVVRDIPKRIF
jgi:hypothetical protein